MLLADALSRRSDAQKRLAQVEARLRSCALAPKGETPEDDAQALLAEARQLVDEIASLVRVINRTNSQTEIRPGYTISDAIADRDALALRRKVLTNAADAGRLPRRHSKDEPKQVSFLVVSDLRREADAVSQQFRQLDLQVQQANFTTEVIQ